MSHSTQIDRQQLGMVSRDKAVTLAHALLAGANKERGEDIAAGVAILFAVLAERTNMDPQELYSLGRRLLTTHDQHHVKSNRALDALLDFAGLRVTTNPSI